LTFEEIVVFFCKRKGKPGSGKLFVLIVEPIRKPIYLEIVPLL
jgi:hypothetical protein